MTKHRDARIAELEAEIDVRLKELAVLSATAARAAAAALTAKQRASPDRDNRIAAEYAIIKRDFHASARGPLVDALASRHGITRRRVHQIARRGVVSSTLVPDRWGAAVDAVTTDKTGPREVQLPPVLSVATPRKPVPAAVFDATQAVLYVCKNALKTGNPEFHANTLKWAVSILEQVVEQMDRSRWGR